MKFLDLARRFVVVSAFGLWLGGFTVYTAFVIPLGHRHFPGRAFGFLTADVTRVLGVLSGAAVVAGAISLAVDWKRLPRGYRWAAAATALALLAALAGAAGIHASLDALLDPGTRHIADLARFEPLHERYELIATIQWGLGLIYLGIQLAAWRRLDRDASARPST
jgi:hypothetical protein